MIIRTFKKTWRIAVAIKSEAVKLLKIYGFNITTFLKAVKNTPRFLQELRTYNALQKSSKDIASCRFPVNYRDVTPLLQDYNDNAGSANGSYFHQDLWAARLIYNRRPLSHIDVGSRVDGFTSHLLVFMDVSVIDVRDLESGVPGLNFVKADATSMKGFEDDSLNSLSSLHAAEHFGLGRYGDPIDPDACFSFMRSLQRVLKPKGRLYFSVPIGRERLVFNGCRVFDPATVIEIMSELQLTSFSAVSRDGKFIKDAAPENYLNDSYICGLFEFTKG